MIFHCLNMCVVVTMCVFGLRIADHKPDMPERGVDPQLQEYVNRFELQLKARCGYHTKMPAMDVDLGSTKDPFKPSVVGWCMPFQSPLKIMIDADNWEYSTDLEREELMFHELGHCVLELDHNEEKFENEHPKSIMYPYTLPESTYRARYQYYMDELFSKVDCTSFEGGGKHENKSVQ